MRLNHRNDALDGLSERCRPTGRGTHGRLHSVDVDIPAETWNAREALSCNSERIVLSGTVEEVEVGAGIERRCQRRDTLHILAKFLPSGATHAPRTPWDGDDALSIGRAHRAG